MQQMLDSQCGVGGGGAAGQNAPSFGGFDEPDTATA